MYPDFDLIRKYFYISLVIERGRALLEKNDTEKCFDADKMSRRWYTECINETKIEELGVQPLLDSLKVFGGWPVLDEDSSKSYDSFKWYDQTTLLNKEGFSLNYIMSHYKLFFEARVTIFAVLHVYKWELTTLSETGIIILFKSCISEMIDILPSGNFQG